MTNGDLSARMWSVRFALFDRYDVKQVEEQTEYAAWSREVRVTTRAPILPLPGHS
jgi:hypothetical protein